jgi:hypothetical protein
MSSLLEQAIVDAKALREAALKNAEQMVIEKYSDQIKDAVSTLLEQDDEFAEGPSEEAPDLDADFESDVPVSDSDVVELDLQALEQQIAAMEEEEGINASDEFEDDKIDRENMGAEMEDDIMASPDADSLATETFDQLEEEIANTFADDLIESLKVDMKPQKRGFMGVSNEEIDYAVEMELARMQDDEVKEQLEALKSALGRVEESNKSLNKNNQTLVTENEELNQELSAHKSAIIQLKEKFDAVNTSNAKLLYINRTLDCGSLNERQKKKIVEAIAKSEDAKQAKVIYETLQNTVETSHKKSPQSLSEAVNRKSSLLVRAREEQRTTTSADIFAERMQRLAGINKDN